MTTKTYEIEFLTPCFCAGAEQSRAELRPSAIRGELHWWFRALGGTIQEERAAFGHVHGSAQSASTFTVRAQVQKGTGQKDWFAGNNIPQQGMGNKTYLLGFFCGRTERLKMDGALPPGSTATVSIVLRRPASPRLEQALRVFFSIGALGFRSTRAAGALATQQHTLSEQGWKSLAAELTACGFNSVLLPAPFDDWVKLIDYAGNFLKTRLRSKEGLGISAGRNGTAPNALGSAVPRQASVLHLRPVRIDGKLRLALLEAPHSRILGPDAVQAHRDRGSIIKLANVRP